MHLKKPTIALLLLAGVVVALAALVVRDASLPLTGDWRPNVSVKGSRGEVRLARLVVLPWSEAVPEIERCRQTVTPENASLRPDDVCLYVEFELDVDGRPSTELAESMIQVHGPLKVIYNGRDVEQDGEMAAIEFTRNAAPIYVWGKIVPWRKGLGSGEFVVDYSMTLKTGETIPCKFRFQAR